MKDTGAVHIPDIVNDYFCVQVVFSVGRCDVRVDLHGCADIKSRLRKAEGKSSAAGKQVYGGHRHAA